jgi:hypothetical protein
MTNEEFMQKMKDAFPLAELGRDNDGQLIIYTGLYPLAEIVEDAAEIQKVVYNGVGEKTW